MNKKFDSYFDNGKIIIITTEYNDFHEKISPVENHVSISRAKEIVADLEDAINKAIIYNTINPTPTASSRS